MEDSREIEADNDGEKQEKGKDDLSQQIASETESTISSPKAGEDDTSVECIPDTKSKKWKKRKKKKAETANIAPVNEGEASADHEPLPSTVNIDQAKLDSAKDCSEAHDPMTSITASKKKKKKKKKKKTGSMVCEGEMETGDSLKEQPDKQEILDGSPNFEGASNSGNTEEDQEDLAVMKNEKQEIDADTQSQKGGGDAESIEGENENWSEDAPEDTALVGEEVETSPVPVSEEEDSSCTPKAVPEKVNAAQSGGSIYKVVATGAEDLVIMEDSRKPEAKNTELRPDNDGEKQEKGKDDLSQQLNSITQQITSETESTISSPKAGEDDKSMECISDCKGKKKKKQKKKKAETTNVAPVNEGEVSTDHEPLPSTVNIDQAKLDSAKDCSEAHDPMTSITASKKKKKKKKKTESMVCEGEMKTGDSLKEQPDKKEILDGTPNFEGASNSGNTEEDQEDVAVMKNEKQEIDADTQSQKGGGDAESIESENENWSEDAPEDTALVGEEVETSPALVSEEEDSSCNPKAVPEKVNAAQSGGSIYKAKLDSVKDCSKAHDPMTSITASKKKKKKKKKTGSMVCEGEMKTGDSLKEQPDKQEILDSTPMEGASNSGNTEEDQEDLAVMENEKQEIDADTRSQKGGGDAESIEGEDENWSEDPPEDTALVGEEVETPPVSEEEDSSCTPKAVPEKVNTELATTSDEAKESNEDRWYPDILEEEVETDASEDISSDEPDNEGRNILCIFKLVYGVGLRALRTLFMEINPTWSNQPSDAAGYDKGKMKLSKEEEAIFNNGNVNEWDFSLMTSVLLYSKNCALEISKRPGYDIVLQKLKKCRNKLLGHPCSDGMSDDDFNKTFWPLLSTHFVTLGANPDEIAEIKLQSDEDLHAGGHYKQLFLTEKAKAIHYGKKLDSIESKLDTIIANQTSDAPNKTPISPKDLSGRNWDEWLKFCDAVGDFDTQKNQYILVADALPPEILDCFSNLRSVPWKMVLDFDPMSEEKGFYRSFTSQEGQGSLVSMITPAELKGSPIVSLARQIDPNKIQWLFVNGRSSDTDGNIPTFPDWEAASVKEISRFFVCCCDPDKFDKQKPVVCLILPFRQESVPYLEVTLSRLFENFDDQFNLKTVSFKQEKHLSVLRKVKVRTIDLSPQLVHLGLKEMLSFSSTQQYRMPTSQAKVHADLSEKQYLFLKEHLEILYEGCESLPELSGDPSEQDTQLQNFLDEHRKLFMSGNQISFASLYDNHDAKREIEKDIQIHVQRLLDKGLTRSMMVEIKHSPGTGGTTIARRVMWDLHKAYPCAFIEISSHLYFDEDNSYASKLADRIAALEEICHTSPVILIDGKQSRLIEGLSNKLVRMLGNRGRRALLLRCQHGSKSSSKESQEPSRVHQVFYVDVKLEDSVPDINEFQSKYKEFIERSLGEMPVSGPCRVFHFPLLAMMQKFRPKLKKIIDDTWNEMENLQQEIAVVVAFLQKYANQPTPALLLYNAFKNYIRLGDGKNVTYKDIKQLFSEHLLNLMVPLNPWLRRGRMYQLNESSPQSYTFQHRLVAEMLLKKCFQEQGCDLFRVASQFLQFPVYQCEHIPLLEELFLYNKDGQKKRKFSVLFEELKVINPERAAEVFCEAAEKTNDSTIFAHAARFFAKMEPPSFRRAMELIEQAFQASSSNSKQKFRSICNTKGVVLYFELRHMINTGKIKDLAKLEYLANKVLEAYKDARNFPPTFPNPLIGEVDVWLACIGWIMRNICNRDSEKTLKFLANQCPPFFRTCVSDSFYLLDIVNGIVQSVPSLPDPEETQRRCNDARLSLMKSFARGSSSTGRGRDAEDVVQACKALCSAKNFPKSSALELKRLQAQFILNSSDQIDSLKQEHLEFLLKLLEELVIKENEHRLAYHLMKVCVLVTGKQRYSLEQGLRVCEKWLEVSHHDCLPYFYQMAISFLKILDGHAMEFIPKYLKALKMCREKSQNHCRKGQPTLFVSKEGEGMSRLLTRSTLFRGENDYYSTDVSETVTRFWLVDNRKKLLECKGRIRAGPSSDRGKTYPYIELLQAKVELYVGKNADIGKVDRDFTKGQLVYFVVSFNLQGPVANGITFSPHNPSRPQITDSCENDE